MTAYAPLALYVSYPFCKRKCAFCPRPVCSVPAPTRRRYLGALMREIESSAKAATGQQVAAVRFGGGQPCQATADELSEVIDCIRAHFDVLPNAEFTLKAQPEPQNSPSGWKAAGLDRVDYAVVTADPFLRNLLGLPPLHGEGLRLEPFENIGVILSFGLPGQTGEELTTSIHEALEQGAKHISLRPFALVPNTPLGALYEKRDGFANNERRNIPSKEQAEELLAFARAQLFSAGFSEYLPLHFALPGYESRFALNNAAGGDVLGFGCFARSNFHGMRIKNTEFVDVYIASSPDFDKITAEFAIVG
ncbi:MAG: hypothetical protein ACOYI3_03900 [Christensenellales bacterium]